GTPGDPNACARSNGSCTALKRAPLGRSSLGPAGLEINLRAELDNAESTHSGIGIGVRPPVIIFRNRQRISWTRVCPGTAPICAVILVLEVWVVECVIGFQSKLDITLFAVAERNILE